MTKEQEQIKKDLDIYDAYSKSQFRTLGGSVKNDNKGAVTRYRNKFKAPESEEYMKKTDEEYEKNIKQFLSDIQGLSPSKKSSFIIKPKKSKS